MVRRKRSSGVTGWSWRLAGLALCAFFGLGFLSGLGVPKTGFALRTLSALGEYRQRLLEQAALVRRLSVRQGQSGSEIGKFSGAVAVVERGDGFYELFASGELRGPVSVSADDNLPIISGASLEAARAEQLVEYASVLVRAEAKLSELISEMRLDRDDQASLFLDRSQTEVVLDLYQAPLELDRAASVLRCWRGREAEVASLDMTAPGQAVLRLRKIPVTITKRARTIKAVDRSVVRRAGVKEAGAATKVGTVKAQEAGL